MRVRIQILGMANFTSNITANGNAVTWFDTEDSAPWWFSPVPMDPDGNGYTAINITATLGNDTTSTTGYAYSPGDPSSPIMNDDLRGTTSDDGTANTYNYDAEGRLISIVPYDFESALNIPQREIVFKYDDRGRRTERLIYYADNGDGYPPEWNGTPVLTYNMTYDGWNLVTETGNEIAACYRVFVWGLDKGGAVDDPTPVWGPDAAAQSAAAGAGGAGGVGGLIMGALYADNFYDAESGVCYGYDANGDVMTLVNMGGNSGYYLAPNIPGTLAAYYMYDPFGGLALATGNFAYANPFRFSTKYAEGDFALFNGSIHTCSPDDLDPGLYYCISREYRTDIGRFMSRDPMDEAGGLNLYAACGNDLVNRVDPLGLVFMPPRGTEGPSPGALLEYEAKQAFYEAARHVFTTPQWTGMFDDWYNEAGLNPITITGISDSRNSDIAQNPGFMKMLGCYAHMLLDKTVVPTGLDGGSWIDTNKGQFRWHFNYDPFAAPGGLAAYTDATWFLGSYIATVNDEGGGKFGISVNNVTGWASATAIPYTNHQTTIWPDTFRGHGTGTPYLPSHGGDWTEYFNFETTATCGSCQFP